MTISNNKAGEINLTEILLTATSRVAARHCTPTEAMKIRLALSQPSEYLQGYVDGSCEQLDNALHDAVSNVLNEILYPVEED